MWQNNSSKLDARFVKKPGRPESWQKNQFRVARFQIDPRRQPFHVIFLPYREIADARKLPF